jgi:hypothetical protein
VAVCHSPPGTELSTGIVRVARAHAVVAHRLGTNDLQRSTLEPVIEPVELDRALVDLGIFSEGRSRTLAFRSRATRGR